MTRFAELIEGYRRFRNGGWQEQRDRWEQLAEGQSPKVMVIACSDSRSEPSQIFDTNPGEIFVELAIEGAGQLVVVEGQNDVRLVRSPSLRLFQFRRGAQTRVLIVSNTFLGSLRRQAVGVGMRHPYPDNVADSAC